MDKLPAGPVEDPDVPVSARIRNRLRQANKRFHANDNIADFIEPGERDRLLEEVTAGSHIAPRISVADQSEQLRLGCSSVVFTPAAP
jgi:hypothetical protein